MRCSSVLVGLFVVAVFASRVSAQQENSFKALTTWGRWLYAYDAACWVATDTVMASHPDSSRLGVYVALQVGTQWVVAFGRTDSAHFGMTYEVILDSTKHVTAFASYAPPLVAPDVLYRAARAFRTGTRAFGRRSRPFNPMVLPEANGTWAVYFVPAETSSDSVYIGGDLRYTVSADGLSIIETTRFHETLLVMPKPRADAALPGLMHSHALIAMPCETDVFYVLRQKPRVRHYVRVGNRSYAIEPDGEIRMITVH